MRVVSAAPSPLLLRMDVAAEAAWTEDLRAIPTYQRNAARVWRHTLRPYVRRLKSIHDPPPLVLGRSDVAALRRKICRRNPESDSAKARLQALRWVFDALEDCRLLRVPRIRWDFKRFRDYAVPPTRQAFADAAVLGRGLTEYLTRRVLAETADSALEPSLAVITLLIWEGPVLVPHAPAVLSHTRMADYASQEGFLRVRPPETESDDAPAAPTVATIDAVGATGGVTGGDLKERHCRRDGPGQSTYLRYHLRPLARLLLNAYIIRRAAVGGLSLSGDTLLFPELAAQPSAEVALTGFLRRCVRAMDLDVMWNQPELQLDRITAQRLLDAARHRALEFFPPVIVATLSRRLHYTPTGDAELAQLHAPACPFLPDGPPFTVRVVRAAPHRSTVATGKWRRALVGLYRAAHAELQEVLWCLSRTQTPPPLIFVRARARRLVRMIRGPGWAYGVPPVEVRNLLFVARYLLSLLDEVIAGRRKLARNTIRNRMQGLASAVEGLGADRPLWELDDEEWIDWVAEEMTEAASATSKRAVRSRLRAFQQYLELHEQTPETPFCHVDWDRLGRIPVAAELRTARFLLPWEIEGIRATLRARATPELGVVLDLFVLLCAGAGLRRREACEFRLADVHIGTETLIAIRRSKTDTGRRFVPLHLLLPEADLNRFWQFVHEREIFLQAHPTSDARLLACPSHPDGFEPNDLGSAVNEVMREITTLAEARVGAAAAGGKIPPARHASCHSLRHSFLSLSILRYFVAAYQGKGARSLGRLLQADGMERKAWRQFLSLFSPTVPDLAPRESYSDRRHTYTRHPFQVLATLAGHTTPEVTVNVYIQTMDWLHRLFIDREIALKRESVLDIDQVAAAIGRHPRTVRNQGMLSEHDRRTRPSRLISYQLERLRQIKDRPPSRAASSKARILTNSPQGSADTS
jgi:integrase